MPIVVGGALLFLGAPAYSQSRHFERHFPVTGKPLVTLHNASGQVQVKSWEKNEVKIVADYASDKIEISTEQADDRIEAETEITGDNATPQELVANYVITVPQESALQVQTDSGSVVVESVHGNMTFDTVGANLQLSDVDGYLVVKSVDGSLVCTRCAGSLDANSIGGSFQLLQPSMDSVRIQTSSGNILFDGNFLRLGIYVLKNSTGTIEVRFAPTDSFDVTASSLYGKVINEAPVKPDTHGKAKPPKFGNGLFGSVNQGSAKVELSSFSGTIKILKRD
ncbi:MAG: DUF4097 family beta strand repeat-containing protein [Candidatus Acidiferrales bacterium]